MSKNETALGDSNSLTTSIARPFEQVIAAVKGAFKDEGFGVLSEIDVQKALQEKIGETMEPYTILGMCNPPLASRAIKAEHEIGVFLPCNVLVHACGGRVHVRAQDPVALFRIIGNPDVEPLALEVRERIARAIAAVSSAVGP